MSTKMTDRKGSAAASVSRVRFRDAIATRCRTISKAFVVLPSLIALFDQGIVSVTNFATAVMIGRVCGKADLGVYSLALTLITVATGLISALVSSPYTVFGPQLQSSRKRIYLGSLLVHELLLSVVSALTICAVAIGGRYIGWFSNSNTNVGLITATVIVFSSFREFVRSVSFAELRVGWALAVDLMSCTLQVGGMLLFIHFSALSVSNAYAILAVSCIVATAGWVLFQHSTFCLDKRYYLIDLKRNWNFGKWILGSSLLWQAAGYLFPWILAAFHGSSVTGEWAACVAIVGIGNPVLLGLSNYLMPKISTIYAISGVQQMKHHVYRYSLLFAVLLLPIVIGMAVIGERILATLYGRGYEGTGYILVLLASNLLVVTVARPFAQGLFSLNCARADTFINLIWVALMIVVGVPVIRLYASIGAAVTMMLSGCTALILKYVVFTREAHRSSIRFSSLRPGSVASSVACELD